MEKKTFQDEFEVSLRRKCCFEQTSLKQTKSTLLARLNILKYNDCQLPGFASFKKCYKKALAAKQTYKQICMYHVSIDPSLMVVPMIPTTLRSSMLRGPPNIILGPRIVYLEAQGDLYF